MEYEIKFFWDEDAAVWVTTSDDIPGLILESESLDTLFERVRLAAPEMLKLNNAASNSKTLHFIADRYEKVALNG